MRWRLLHFCIFRWLVQFDAESDIISVRLILQWRVIPSLLKQKINYERQRMKYPR